MNSDKILVKDGGFATQLSVHVGNIIDGDPLWSARFNKTNPDSVINTHLDFLNAGADIILTNTYQASVEGYTKYLNINEEQSVELIRKTVQLAHVAKEKYLNQKRHQGTEKEDAPMIIASIGPYGAHLHDGSEYNGSYIDNVQPEIIRKWHRVRINAVLEAGVDALAIETIPCRIEAEIIIDLLFDEHLDVKFWISFQCKNEEYLAHGESFKDTVQLIWEKLKTINFLDHCLAIGVNCTHPKNVTPLFKSINGSENKYKIPLVTYPNSGEVYRVQDGWNDKDCVQLEHYVSEWIELGAKIIGGCCRTYTKDIKRIKKCVKSLSIN